jgi:signal transduction histidine kinase
MRSMTLRMSALALEPVDAAHLPGGSPSWRTLQVLFGRSPAAVVVADDDGVCVGANPAAERLFGIRPLAGRYVGDFAGSIADFQRRWRVFKARGMHRGKVLVRRPDGRRRIAAYSATADVIPGHHLAVLHDVTAEWVKARRRTTRLAGAGSRRQQAERALAEMEASSRARERGLAVFAHELRNAVTSVLGSVRLLQRGALTPLQREHALRAIEHGTELQTRLVNDLLDAARIATGTMAFELARVDVLAVVAEAVETARPVAETKGVELVLRAAPGPTPASADAVRLRQAFLNVVSNAVKFTPAGGRITVDVRAGADAIVVGVTDTGCGVPPSLLARVFDPFVQADETANGTARGLGLGLTIVRHIVEAHGGVVRATSEGRGRGATFEMVLPAVVTPAPR